MSKENDLIVIYAGTAVEAGMIQGLLEDAGIKAFLRDEILGSIAPWYVIGGGAGAVKVVVARKDLDKARPIVQEFWGEKPAK